jgi:hypothetical protein
VTVVEIYRPTQLIKVLKYDLLFPVLVSRSVINILCGRIYITRSTAHICFAEYKKMKNPSFVKACRITTQKLLYFVVFLASLLRAAYFTQPESAQPSWCYYLMSAFYPLVMTCASLIVCYWAEVSFVHRLMIMNVVHKLIYFTHV